jgi:hypothetical protein
MALSSPTLGSYQTCATSVLQSMLTLRYKGVNRIKVEAPGVPSRLRRDTPPKEICWGQRELTRSSNIAAGVPPRIRSHVSLHGQCRRAVRSAGCRVLLISLLMNHPERFLQTLGRGFYVFMSLEQVLTILSTGIARSLRWSPLPTPE